MTRPRDQGQPDPIDRSTENLSATVIRGAGFAGAGFALSKLLMLSAYAVVARLITPEEFGQFAAAAILVEVGMLVADSGTTAAVIHRRDRLDEAAATAVVSTFVGGLILALLALASSPLVGAFFDSDQIGIVCAAMSGVIFIRALGIVPAALLQRRFSFLRRMISEPASALAFGVAAVVATANGLGVWGLVIGFYALAATEALSSWLLLRWRPRLRLASFATWRELAGYGRHVFVAAVILRAGDLIPGALLGRFAGTSSLGQFRYAERIAGAPTQLLLAGGAYVIFPAFSAIAEDSDRFRPAIMRTLTWAAIIAFPVGLLMLPLGEPLAVLVLGPAWQEAGAAAGALCVFIVARVVANVAAEAWKAAGRPELLTREHLFETVLAVAAVVALLGLGPEGAAIGLSLGAAGGVVYSAILSRRVFGLRIRDMLRVVTPPAVAASATALALLALDRLVLHSADQGSAAGLTLLLGESLAGLALYVGVLRSFSGQVGDELIALTEAAKGRLRRRAPVGD